VIEIVYKIIQENLSKYFKNLTLSIENSNLANTYSGIMFKDSYDVFFFNQQ